ncbi:MAG: alpha/beta fold hydrolase [Gemmatimonadales bacterium]
MIALLVAWAVLAQAPPATEGFVTTPDSVRLWYRVVGNGRETIIAPNALYHRARLDPLAEGRRLVFYDARGRGRSDRVPPGKVSLAHQLADFDAIRRAVGAERVALIGWSGSGMELFVYALRHPGRVTRLIQLAPVPPRRDPWTDSLMSSRAARTDSAAWADFRHREQRGEFAQGGAEHCRAFQRATLAASFGDPAHAAEAPDVCDSPNEWLENIGPYFTALLGSLGAFDWRDSLSRVTVPRLVIHGERDNIPLEGSREWVAGQPNARLLIVAGAGHWPHHERPEPTLQAMATFLAGGWPAGSEALPGPRPPAGGAGTAAPPPLPPPASYRIQPLAGDIELDGRMDEPAWESAVRIPLDYEWFPGENLKPPVETDCRMAHDTGNLFIACHAIDPRPERIRAHYADRDDLNRVPRDDHILILIDPFNDERRGFQFRVNAVGVQMDALFATAEGIEDFSWDAIWASAGRIVDDGYVVELAIPFRSLRFPETAGEQTWGVLLERSWPRSARHRMQSAPRNFANACLLCETNKVTGFAGITPGSNVELYPTLTSRRTDVRAPFPAGPLAPGDVEVDPGLDLRWGVTSNLSLNATANPDFSQVEADVAQLDVNTRFALFFPERRPFFLEGADFFATPVQAVFTRTVADPSGGLKVSGKLGRAGLGVFAAHDRVTNLLFPANQGTADTSLALNTVSAAVRYRQDLGRSSYVGVLYTGRASSGDYGNRVGGADAFLQIGQSHSVRLQALGSVTEYPDAVAQAFAQPAGRFTGAALNGSYQYATREWFGTLELGELSPDFRADAGFVPRVDVRSALGTLTRTIFGRPGQPFTQLQFGAIGAADLDHEWQLTDIVTQLSAFWLGPAQTSVLLEGFRNRERLHGVDHDLTNGRVTLQSQPWGSAQFELQARFGEQLDVANSRTAANLGLSPSAQLYLGRRLNLDLQHDFQRLSSDGTRIFTANLLQGRVIYHLSLRTFVRAVLQWQHIDRNPGAYGFPVEQTSSSLFTQLLLSYKLNPQTVAFLGYSDSHRGTDAIELTRANRTFFVKLGYALRP